MAIETLPFALTTTAEMKRKFSELGVNLRADDDDDGVIDPDVIKDCVDEASDDCFGRIMYFYDINAEATANNLWLRLRATTIGCFHLSQRRANPANFEAAYERAIADLDLIASGERQIPRLPYKADLSPGMSNVTIDDRATIRKVRVQSIISTGGSMPNRDEDRRFFYADNFIW